MAANLDKLVETLNSSRDFYGFLRQVRKAFKEHVEQERARR